MQERGDTDISRAEDWRRSRSSAPDSLGLCDLSCWWTVAISPSFASYRKFPLQAEVLDLEGAPEGGCLCIGLGLQGCLEPLLLWNEDKGYRRRRKQIAWQQDGEQESDTFHRHCVKKKDSKDVGNWKLVVIRKNFTNHSISNGIVVKECEQVHLRWASKSAWHGLTTSIERKRWVTAVRASFLLPFTCGLSRETIQDDLLLAERQILLL